MTGTPSATPSAWTFDGSYTTNINCDRLTNGLTLTIGPDAKVGTEATPVDEIGIVIDAGHDSDSAGDNPVTLVNSGTIHSNKAGGIEVIRDGAGALKVEHKAGKIVGTGTVSTGIYAKHKGKEDTVTGGIHIVSSADIDLSKSTNTSQKAIEVTTNDAPATATIPIRIEFTGGTISTGTTNGWGMRVTQYAKGDITITTGPKAVIGKKGMDKVITISATLARTTGVGNIVITHRGKLYGSGRGIWVSNSSTSSEEGDVTVTVTEEGEIRTQTNRGMDIGVYNTASTGDIKIIHNGMLSSKYEGIIAIQSGKGDVMVETGKTSKVVTTSTTGTIGRLVLYGIGIDASLRGSDREGDLTIVHRGEINAREEGIVAVIGGSLYSYLNNPSARDADSGGTIKVTTAEGSKVTGGKDGIFVWHNGGGTAGQGRFDVAVRGTVTGGDRAGDDRYAGIRIAAKGDVKGNGGMIAIGPRGHVSAKSGVAIEVEANAGPVTVVLEQDADGLVGHLKGKILHPATVTFKTRAGQDAGTERALAVGDTVNRRGETRGVYDDVFQATLTKITGGHEFEEQSQTRLYHDRARVYEALPSVLLDLTEQASYHERMAAPRSGHGVWARVAARDAARRPARATTAQDVRGRPLAWDVSRYGLEAGIDFIPGASKRLLLGLSLHARQGEATVAHGGTIDVSGFGGGGSATYRDPAGFYLDGRFSYTYFDDVDLTSRTRGAVQADLSGHGYAVGLEAGQRLALAGLDRVALTPRVRLVWASVELEDFADLAGLPGSGRVALETATSFKGRFGVLAETAVGGATIEDWTGDGGRLFGSLDVEKEFLVDRKLQASGTALASEVRATWMRVGFGGTVSWNAGLTTLAGEGFYATAGFGNTDFGGSLTLSLRF